MTCAVIIFIDIIFFPMTSCVMLVVFFIMKSDFKPEGVKVAVALLRTSRRVCCVL